jgi:hypothetical protein
MVSSFAMMHAGFAPARNPTQFVARRIVPGTRSSDPLQFSAFSDVPEPVEAASVSYRGTAHEDKMQVSIRHFPTAP